jgi:SAM-dependent methyltransferase
LSDTPAPKPELEASGRDAAARERSASQAGGVADALNKKDVEGRQASLISKTLVSAKGPIEEEESEPKKVAVVADVAAPADVDAPKDGVAPEPAPKPLRPSVPPRPSPSRATPGRTTGPPTPAGPRSISSPPTRVSAAPPAAAMARASAAPAVVTAPAAQSSPATSPSARAATTLASNAELPASSTPISVMPIISLGTAPNQDNDAVSIISTGIRRSSIPPPPPLDPSPSALGSDGGIGLLRDLPRARPPADSLVETVALPRAPLKSDPNLIRPGPATAAVLAALDDDATAGPAIDVALEEDDDGSADFDVDDATESEPPPDTEVVSERETLRADDVIESASETDTPTDPVATVPMPIGYQAAIEGQKASERAIPAAAPVEPLLPVTERRAVTIVDDGASRTAASTAGPNDDTQPEGIRARASEPPPEVDPEDMEIHEASAIPRSGEAKKPPPPKALPPLQARGAALAAAVQAQRAEEPSGLKRARYWWDELFGDDFLRTMDRPTDAQIKTEVNFIEESLGVQKGGVVLDLACGAGRHAVEMAARGYNVVGYDLSLAMLARAADEAHDRKQKLNFLHGDMRDMGFEEMFDGIYCWSTSFGYFDDEKNQLVAARIHRALRSGGMLLLDLANRDFVTQRQPSLVWFEGDGCVCMDEMRVDFITSRLKVKRMVILDDGRTREMDYSIRLYTLHELGRMLHDVGFKVTDVSGHPATPGVFMGADSPRLIVCAERA